MKEADDYSKLQEALWHIENLLAAQEADQKYIFNLERELKKTQKELKEKKSLQ